MWHVITPAPYTSVEWMCLSTPSGQVFYDHLTPLLTHVFFKAFVYMYIHIFTYSLFIFLDILIESFFSNCPFCTPLTAEFPSQSASKPKLEYPIYATSLSWLSLICIHLCDWLFAFGLRYSKYIFQSPIWLHLTGMCAELLWFTPTH